MPDTQTLLDRGFTTSEIRTMRGSFTALSPRERVHQNPALLLRAPVLDACNHAR